MPIFFCQTKKSYQFHMDNNIIRGMLFSPITYHLIYLINDFFAVFYHTFCFYVFLFNIHATGFSFPLLNFIYTFRLCKPPQLFKLQQSDRHINTISHLVLLSPSKKSTPPITPSSTHLYNNNLIKHQHITT